MAVAAANVSANSFLVMGHGIEIQSEYEDRPTLPDGITLVLLSECGIVTDSSTVHPFIEAFSNPELQEGLSKASPKTLHKIHGDKTLHIIRPGQKYPPLVAQMFLDFKYPGNENKIRAMKSGLYKFPIAMDDWKLNPTNPADSYTQQFAVNTGYGYNAYYYQTQTIKNPVAFSNLYKDSLLPTIPTVMEHMTEHNAIVNKLHNSLRFRIEDLFAVGGPGVYYWPVCRQIKEHVSIRDFLESADGVLEEERIEQYREFERKNWVDEENSRRLLAMLKEDRPTVPRWFISTIDAIIEQIEKGAPLIRRVRAASKNAANMTGKHEGGARKTRRHKSRRRRLTRSRKQ